MNGIITFNAADWLKSVNPQDKEYDYVMHDSHWLISRWSPDCEQCLAKADNGFKLEAKNTNSSPVKDSNSINYTEHTLKAELSQNDHVKSSTIQKQTKASTLLADISVPLSPPRVPEQLIPVTPIAPVTSHISRAFATPLTTTKFSDTFTRSTRQSTKKLLNQTSNQELINLNETFDLYKSALAETPVAGSGIMGNNGKGHDLLPASIQEEEKQPTVTSKIPRMPVRVDKY